MPQELSKGEVGRQTPKETGVNAGKRGKPAKATTTRRGFLKETRRLSWLEMETCDNRFLDVFPK